MTVAVAGTFDVLHDGHKALLDRAFGFGEHVVIGLTSDRMASEGRSSHIPYHLRKKALEEHLSEFRDYEIFEIDDMYGPDGIMDSVSTLVVSEETLPNGRVLNDRRASRGLEPMELAVVPLVMADDGRKISARAILDGVYGRSGHVAVPDIAVGSLNPVKVEAVRTVMEKVYGEVRITAVDVQSGVPPQPFGDQTHQGSLNRARAALGEHDMAVGIEAGVFEMLDGLYDIQHCSIVSSDGRETYGQGSGFRYPDDIADLVRSGLTVGDAVHEIHGDTDIGKRQGAVGLLSHGLIDRKTLTEQSVTAAMIPRIWSR